MLDFVSTEIHTGLELLNLCFMFEALGWRQEGDACLFLFVSVRGQQRFSDEYWALLPAGQTALESYFLY